MSTSVEKKKITLKAGDGETFEIDEAVAMQMLTIKNMIDDDCAADTIPLPNVKGKTMSVVIEYCMNHVEGGSDSTTNEKEAEKAKKDLDTELMKSNNDKATLFDITLAANYLNVKGLLDLTCQTIADQNKDKMPEEVRDYFNIVNDFTPEEEAEIRKENKWAFE